jgi:lauroyl/myristoyl acyltransferase
MNISTIEDKITNLILSIYKIFILSRNRFYLIKKTKILASLIFLVYKVTPINKFILKNIELALNIKNENNKVKKIEKDFVHNLLKNISDLLKTSEDNSNEILKLVKFTNEENIIEAKSYNKGIIFVSAHYGLWELMAIAVKKKYDLKLSVFAQRPLNKVFEELFYNYRKRLGIETYYNEGISSLKKVDESIKNKECFAFLVDQHGESKNTLVKFIDKEVSFPSVSVNFAYKYNVPIVPVFIKRNEYDIHEITFYKPIFCNGNDKKIAIQKTAQEIYNIFESFILEKPDEWLWTYERFNKL